MLMNLISEGDLPLATTLTAALATTTTSLTHHTLHWLDFSDLFCSDSALRSRGFVESRRLVRKNEVQARVDGKPDHL